MPTSGSDVFQGRLTSFANDGAIYAGGHGKCFTSAKKPPPWWMVDLGARAVIEKVYIWTIHKVFKVDVRAGLTETDRGENNPVCMQGVVLFVNHRNDIHCPAGTIAKHVSVIVNYEAHVRLCEVEVYGMYVR